MLIKSSTDIQSLNENGRRMGEILAELAVFSRAGISTSEVDRLAERLIKRAGGRPAFKGYKTSAADRPFPATICASLNDELVHGIPSKKRILRVGDLFSIDIGMVWPGGHQKSLDSNIYSDGDNGEAKGVYTDTAITIVIGEAAPEIRRLLVVAKQALEEGITAAQPGNSIAAIGKAVQTYVMSQGNYGIVRDLVGHGVGHAVHEDPFIPNYYDKKLESIKLVPGMVIAIEPMIALGDWQVTTLADGWTIAMADQSLCAHFEHTIVINEKGNTVVTRRPEEVKKL